MATDASQTGWGSVWTIGAQRKNHWILRQEATAIVKACTAFDALVCDSQVNIRVDNQAIVNTWHNYGGRSQSLNCVSELVLYYRLSQCPPQYVIYTSHDHPLDQPSGRLSPLD